MTYQSMTDAQLRQILEQEQNKFNKYVKDGIKLDMARGKPGAEQLDISEGMLNVAKGKFSNLENVSFKLIDIEKDTIDSKFDKYWIFTSDFAYCRCVCLV